MIARGGQKQIRTVRYKYETISKLYRPWGRYGIRLDLISEVETGGKKISLSVKLTLLILVYDITKKKMKKTVSLNPN